MREVDVKRTAEALKVQLETGLKTLADIFPGDPDGHMSEVAKDIERFHKIGLLHPMEKVAAGAAAKPEKEDEENAAE